ncbi:FitA-like ribbon-helix-helix domain-containing protein [Amycolatopsis suaedae]|uniref:Arc family DNA-binding protein n=1 Tax=Amycolatopsis suaedae TaxID=2510978 RepID=A0A4Q7IYA8_9PSEU|nr:Arc family DNA-binding protein [Amycolatopsis suaedae]RZQ59950.1 Arc family DNA-binding protein [Amycolatopsis suaedae]
MANLTIRDFDDGLKAELRVRAARNGRSMEAEVRAILTEALSSRPAAEPGPGLGTRIHQRFAGPVEFELPLPDRHDLPRAADLPR